MVGRRRRPRRQGLHLDHRHDQRPALLAVRARQEPGAVQPLEGRPAQRPDARPHVLPALDPHPHELPDRHRTPRQPRQQLP